MKKVLIVLALVVMVLIPVTAKAAATIGGEIGYPMGVTFGFKGEKGTNLYVTAGAGLGNPLYLDVVGGMEFKLTEFKIESETFNVNAGAQAGVDIWLGDYSALAVAVRGTIGVSYDWKQIDWTTYARLGLGARFKVSGGDDAKINPFSWSFVLGMVYHL